MPILLFDIFSFELIEGDQQNILKTQDNVIISQSFSRKLLDPQTLIGRKIQIGDSVIVTINGIFKDIKASAIPQCDIILPWRLVKSFNPTLAEDKLDNSGGTVAALLIKKNSSFKYRENDIKKWFKTFFWPYERNISKEVRIESLKDFYLSGWGNGYPLNSGNRKFLLIFSSIGFLVLLFAVFNYVNLTIAQHDSRLKEKSIRLLMGATKKEIISQSIIESIILTLISVVFALFLSFIFKPFANDILAVKLNYRVLFSIYSISIIFVIIYITGVVAGLIPCAIVSMVSPIRILQGGFFRNKKMVYNKLFIMIQFFIVVIMISSSIIIKMQVKHLLNAPLGFHTANLYEINVMDVNSEQTINTLCDELKSIPGIEKVGLTQGVPTSGSNNISIEYDTGNGKKNISFQQYIMDKECFNMLGLKVLLDNKITGNGWFINREAIREMELAEDSPYFSVGNGKVNIAGIISNFYEKNILGHISPILFRYWKPEDQAWSIIVKMQGDIYETTKKISTLYSKIVGTNINASFLDEQLENSFHSQIRLYKIVSTFTIIAIVISFLGLIGMSNFFVQQKKKEIAIRKVFGATEWKVFILLERYLLKYIILSSIFAIPIAYYIMDRWISNYSYRIELTPVIFIFWGFVCLIVSFLAVFFQCINAANKNPIESVGSI